MTSVPPPKGEFKLLSVEDVRKLPDPQWLIENIIPQGGIAVLYGQSDAGKSFLALDWAAHVCAGLSWLGRPVKGNFSAVYVYAEGRTGLKPRIEAWEADHAERLSGGSALIGLRFLPQAVNIPETDGDVLDLIHTIRKTGLSPGLIIIDTLARNFGDGDENSAKDMNAFVVGLDSLKNAFPDASVLVVHHMGKDNRRGPRGNTALFAAADTVMRFDKKGVLLTLTCAKQKDAEEFKSVPLMLKPVPERKSAVIAERDFLAGQGSEGVIGSRSDETDNKVSAALASFGIGGAPFTKWQKATGLPKSTFKDSRTRLIETGKVIQDGNAYRIAAEGPGAEIRPDQGSPPQAT